MTAGPGSRDQLIADVIRRWRESLVNLTGRNRLLNFSVTRASTLPITLPDHNQVLQRLQSGQRLTFGALKPPPAKADESEDDLAPPSSSRSPAWADPSAKIERDTRWLGANVEPAALTLALRNLMTRTNQTFMDTGLWTLYVAFGTLTWIDPVDSKKYRSPLVLVPASLQSPGPRMPAELALGQEDVVVNPALVLKMQGLDLEIPREIDLDEPSALDAYMRKLQRLVAGRAGWAVGNEVYLSYFTFHKEAMYRDLMDNLDLVMASEQVQALAMSGQDDDTVSFAFEPLDDSTVDIQAPPEDARQVLDADSSQRAAIAAAEEGRSFIVDGPPGTGKSQTITNIIASLIPQGKSVLFVSEKAAALEVVKNRLEEVGLGSYALELHSHKATRKEVAEELSRALQERPRGPAPLSDTALRKLKKARLDLSAYAAAMNQIREPLGMSVHDAMGWVSTYENLGPARPCDGDLAQMSAGDLADIQDAAGELGRAWRPALQGPHFIWRDVVSHSSLHYELGAAAEAIQQLREVTSSNDAVMRAFGWDRPSDAQHLMMLLRQWQVRPPSTPLDWLRQASMQPVEAVAQEMSQALLTLREAEASAERLAGANWRAVASGPKREAFSRLRNDIAQVEPAAPPMDPMAPADLRSARESVSHALQTLAAMVDLCRGLAPKLGLLDPRTMVEVDALVEVERLSRSGNRPEGDWLKTEVDAQVEAGLDRLQEANDACQQAQEDAAPYFTEKVLELDPQALNIRFQNVHRGLHKLSADYRKDVRALAEASIPGIKGKANIPNLTLAVQWQTALAERDSAEEQFATLIGPRYKRLDTDWAGLRDALTTARNIAAAAKNSVLESLMSAVANGAPLDPGNAVTAQRITDLRDQLSRDAANPAHPWLPSALMDLSLSDQQSWLEVVQAHLERAVGLVSDVEGATSASFAYAEAEEACRAVEEALAAGDSFDGRSGEAEVVLGSSFLGRDTEIPILEQCLQWAREMRSAARSRRPSQEADELGDELIKSLENSIPSPALEVAIARHEAAVLAVCDAFTPARGRELWDELDAWSEGPELLMEMQEDSAGQDEWFAYTHALGELEPWGLRPVVEALAEVRLASAEVPSVITREVMRRWVDQVLEAEPVLRDTRAQDRDAIAREFRELDAQLVSTTVSHVINEANAFRPTTTVGQAGIILAEGRKKRRHMPIRELLARTVDVSLGIKPVFMMSPLSVSQYLPPDLRFDVVIFDEASQVMPEDAVNCIYRGSSLIIAGDEKQLPPTNFFELGTGDGDETWEEDQSSARDFESILSIAKGCGAFMSLTLKWHYRSRHEALIAFSNNRFYQGELITFPSSQAEGPSVGVEFFLVENGVYDRGGSRRNMVEARYVAERIVHHYDTRPGMSLGIVAFSQAQAEAIQFALEEVTLLRPDLEGKFGGSRLDGLFIKNLESVQGDERDVMIFSIGYGPDADGKLTMNFGPINRDGGWRRLNVAITRARYRNEVIASFSGSQMSASNVRSVNEFRRYLDFAAHGMSALSLDDELSLGDAESPFEESVLTWLRSEGYQVTPQVGSSGYRIDMAVHHPQHPARFVLGIECDGVAYHSSQTARDRDRLREQVLTGLGWNLHRIWGTAWYRHRESEQRRLKDAIESAIAAPPQGLLPRNTNAPARHNGGVILEEVELGEIAPWAAPYRKASPPRPPRHVSPSEYESVPHHVTIIEKVVAKEGPIHIEILDQRIREAWQVGRIGSSIRAQISRAIDRANVQVDGDFLLPPTMDGSYPTRTHDADTKRDIVHIYMGELEETTYRVIRDAVSIELDRLIVSVARHLGFARVGDDVRAAIVQAVRNLETSGWISDDDDTRIRVLLISED